jgi:murein DD-endopeptidase MepM/ murein hydrolase activator NlpD
MRSPLLPMLMILLAGTGAHAQDAASGHKTHHKPHVAADETTPPSEESEHVVQPGETLGGIAARAKVPRILIAEANGMRRPYRVHNGQLLKLPRTRHHTVRDGETGFEIAYRYGVPFSAIAVANGMKPDADLKTGQDLLIPTLIGAGVSGEKSEAKHSEGNKSDTESKSADNAADAPIDFAWPLAGKVKRGFRARGRANYHDGIDIAAQPGTGVRASAAGTVIFAGHEPQDFGKLVVIDHGRTGGHAWQSAYGFLGRITVKKGDTIKRHERLGLVGHTGKAKSDELHFEIRKDNNPVDPVDELPGQE